MKRVIVRSALIACASSLAFSQSTETLPRFEAADVHASAKILNPSFRTGPVRGGRYELKNATMLDLVRTAYGFDADKILGGPSWLELDRFDVIAKLPPESTPDTRNAMLQALLSERFNLMVHKDTRPVPTYVLTVGKKPQLKEADGSGDSGCKPQSASGGPGEGGTRLTMLSANGGPASTITLGPGGIIEYVCRNITIADFAAGLNRMLGASLGPDPVLDRTGLTGKWNFNVRWTVGVPLLNTDSGGSISVFNAIDRQLGLKLEQQHIPTSVLLVDRVDQKPAENPPGTAEALPPIPAPVEFEVATIKPTDPNARPFGRFQMQPGGRLVIEGLPLRFLISRAFNTNNNEMVTGLPPWADTERFDINALASDGTFSAGMDQEVLAPMLRALLADRFKMTYHTEERPVSAYTLLAVNPKMKKADPASRTWCKNGTSPPPGSGPGTSVLNCQNVTMAQFAERLQNIAVGLNWPVSDGTELAGTWDFTLTFDLFAGINLNLRPAGRGGADPGQPAGAVPLPSDPAGGGYSIFQAVEKQLGLKLEKQKRSFPVIVIDHLEPKPTDN